MKYLSKIWDSMLARRTVSIILCAAMMAASAGVCAATTSELAEETRQAREAAAASETVAAAASENAAAGEEAEDETSGETAPGVLKAETGAAATEEGTSAEEEIEDTRCIHAFIGAWVGYECSLKDYVPDYEPGDEVRIRACFNKKVGSQFGLYIDGAWNSFAGEGKARNITLIPDSDYLNIQITDMKGLASVNLTDISVEIVKKGEEDNGSYLHRFTGLWQGFETKFSEYNPDYAPGDEVKVTVVYNKKVTSQLGMNIGGEWTTESGEGKELVKTVLPDNDYLNIQISDMWASYSVGIVSISVEITRKGVGGSGGGALTTRNYTEPGDYLLFSGEQNESYECTDAWILYAADTDYLTLTYDCAPEHENWGVLGWQGSVDGEWKDGPSYSADGDNSAAEKNLRFSVRYLRKMMGITEDSSVGSFKLGAWSEGRIKDLTLHVGSEIPRDMHLFQKGLPNQTWVCDDIERLLDLPDEKYICIQYSCSTPDYEGWTVLTWNASVDGEWRTGKSYKTSYREATRNHFSSMRMDVFRNMLHLSWDAKVDSVQLSAFNGGTIIDIWISDKKVEDPGDFRDDREGREGRYSSGNDGTYDKVTDAEGISYEQGIALDAWGWTAGDDSLENEAEIISGLRENTYLVVTFSPEKAAAPSLQFTMSDGKQKQVKYSYLANGQAVFSYRDIAAELSAYLVPQEVANLQISAGEDPVTIDTVKVVKDESGLKEEPIAVLVKDWSGFGTEISKWHSDYEVGDTVTVTVTLDKAVPSYIAFNLSEGNWDRGGRMNSKVISRTATPYNDHMDITIGELPKGKSHVKILDIKVEIANKKNFNDYVKLEGGAKEVLLSSTKKEAATAALTDQEINAGTSLVLVTEESALSEAEAAQVEAMFAAGADEPQVRIAETFDITAFKEKKDGSRSQLTETNEAVTFKVPIPQELEGKGYEFAVVREHEGALTFLEDLDGNAKTVTFKSSKFSKFTVVYTEEGGFDAQSGAIKVFREAWAGFDTALETYNSAYEVGDEVKVTLNFDRDVKSKLVLGGDWDGGVYEREGAAVVVTATPKNGSVTLQIADMKGAKTVKLTRISVEITKKYDDGTAMHVFKQKDVGFETHYSIYLETYQAGRETTVTLAFDRSVKARIGYNAPNTGWTSVEGTSMSTTLTKTITPGDDYLNIQIADLNGYSAVKLLSVMVEQEEEPEVPVIHQFTPENKGTAYGISLTQYCPEYADGDTVTINVTMDSDAYFKAAICGNIVDASAADGYSWKDSGGFESSAGEEITLTWTYVPKWDPQIQIWGMDGTYINVTEITVEKATAEDAPIHQFTPENKSTAYGISLTQYCPEYADGDTVTINVTMDSDAYFKAAVCGNTADDSAADGYSWKDSGGFESSAGEEITLTWTYVPKWDPQIQIWGMNGTYINVKMITVEVTQPAAATLSLNPDLILSEPICAFGAAGDEFVVDLAELCELEVAPGDEVKVELTLVSGLPFAATLEPYQETAETASPSDAEAAPVIPADPENQSGTEPVPEIPAEAASPSDAAPASVIAAGTASPSDAEPAGPSGVQETASSAAKKTTRTYESDADGVLTMKWSGTLADGRLLLTVSEMTDGCPVYLDCAEAEIEEKGELESGIPQPEMPEPVIPEPELVIPVPEAALPPEPAADAEPLTADVPEKQDENLTAL